MAISQQQKEDRKEWVKRLDYLVSCTKLNHDDENYMYIGDLIDLIYDTPEYDISDYNRKKYLKLCGVEE